MKKAPELPLAHPPQISFYLTPVGAAGGEHLGARPDVNRMIIRVILKGPIITEPCYRRYLLPEEEGFKPHPSHIINRM